ncbi:MAG: hypothetical protein AAGE59_37920 [Cyanobacteria bacterium P01_F01_bin.86]
MTTTTLTTNRTNHQRRLRAVVKRLVIELGLENCLTERLQDANVQAAASGIDSAIDCLNEHLSN